MVLSENERLVLTAIRDGVFSTVRELTQATGLPYQAVRYNYWRLMVSGLVQGFEVTYAGHKMLAGEPLKSSDMAGNVDLRHAK